MQVKPVVAGAPTGPVAPIALPVVPAAKTSAPADAFGGAAASSGPAAAPLSDSATAGALWGARTSAVSESVSTAAGTKPSFEGVACEKGRYGRALQFTVKPGDTLSALSRRSGVDVQSLVNFNQLQDANLIRVGQKIELPTTFHEVKPGETYWGIAHAIGIDHHLLMKLNGAQPDGLLRVGQELQVPASIVTPAQAKTREALTALIDDAARAESKMFFGPGSFRPFHVGNELGYLGVADSDARFQFSDDFKTVKISEGQSDLPPRVLHLDHPVADLRRVLVTDTIKQLALLHVETLREQFPQFPHAFNVVGPKSKADGTVELTITGPADGDQLLTFDPGKGSLSISDASDQPWSRDLSGPSDAVKALAERFKLKLPLYG